ncbi:MAG: hypothetical protein JNK09_14655, partial [Prolixibacteraceae bacterium]|nr:hypothetical protein [Prolixibacteraceae bacterium]
MKKVLLSFLLLIAVLLPCRKSMAQTTLSPGDIVIVAINGDSDATNSLGRGFSFMTLVNLDAGTEIFFTDYGWSDLTNYFITNTSVADQFAKYIVPSGGLAAGTIVRFDSYHTTDFTVFYCYGSASLTTYLNVAGLTNGDEVLIFQANYDSSTHVFSSINFIYAASIVSTSIVSSGWATNVGTNGTDNSGAGSALPPGLTDDATALSFNQPAIANDNCTYSGSASATTKTGWQDRIKSYSNWTFNDAPPIPTPPTGPFTVTGSSIVPTVTTQAVSNITVTTATGNGNITSLGSPNPTAYGVCWNTTGTPTISDSKVDKGAASVTGAFTASLTSLSAGTTYYVRAYATNSAGTSYGAEVSFTTSAATINVFEDFESYNYSHWANIASGSVWGSLKIFTQDMGIVFIHTASEGAGTGNGAKSISANAGSSSSWISFKHKDGLTFSLNSMALGNPNTTWGSQYLTVQGYRNGIKVKEKTDVLNWSTTTPITTNYTGWDDLDEIKILEPNMGSGDITYMAAYIDDISLTNIGSSSSAPTVTTQAVSSISTTTATGNGNITDLGVPNPTQYGVVWSTSTNPTVALTTKTAQGAIAATGAFTSSITGLSANTTYYVKAYATNTAGTSYGSE